MSVESVEMLTMRDPDLSEAIGAWLQKRRKHGEATFHAAFHCRDEDLVKVTVNVAWASARGPDVESVEMSCEDVVDAIGLWLLAREMPEASTFTADFRIHDGSFREVVVRVQKPCEVPS